MFRLIDSEKEIEYCSRRQNENFFEIFLFVNKKKVLVLDAKLPLFLKNYFHISVSISLPQLLLLLADYAIYPAKLYFSLIFKSVKILNFILYYLKRRLKKNLTFIQRQINTNNRFNKAH